MAGKASSAKNAAMAADLKKRGIFHGKRLTKGLSNIPANQAGSAAYRRLQERKRQNNR